MKQLLTDLYCLAVVAVVEVLGRSRIPSIRSRHIALLTHLAYRFSRRKRRAIERNVACAFGADLDPRRRREIVQGSFREFWVEMLHWVPSFGRTLPVEQVRVTGIENLRLALERKKGVIIWESNGFGRRLLAKRVLKSRGYPVCEVRGYTHMGVLLIDEGPGTRIRSRILRPLFRHRAQGHAAETLTIPLEVSVARSREYLRRLAGNSILCVAGEGRVSSKLHLLQFLGQETPFATGFAKVSRLSEAPIVPMFWVPSGGPLGTVQLLPPISVPTSADKDCAALWCVRQFASELETRIRRWPEYYRNWHMVGPGLPLRGRSLL